MRGLLPELSQAAAPSSSQLDPLYVAAKTACLAIFLWAPSLSAMFAVSLPILSSVLLWALLRLRKARLEIAKMRLALQERNNVLNHIPALTMASDQVGNLLYVNDRIMAYTGLSKQQLTGEGWLQTVHPADLEELRGQWVRAIVAKTPMIAEYRWRRSDGVFRRFRVEGNCSFAGTENDAIWYSFMRDIEECRTKEELQTQAQSAMTESNRFASVAEMAASIAHEINQPLMAVMTNAAAGKAWLTGPAASEARAVDALDRIERDAGSAALVVTRIRALFKRTPLQRTPVLVKDVIDQTVRGLEAEIRRRSARLRTQIPSELPVIHGDPIQLRQVLHNLLQNALEATEAESEDRRLIEVEVVAHPDRHKVEIAVRDSGPGTPDVHGIFEAFTSTKTSGLGIGLALSRSIVEGHQGSIRAERRHPFGMSFMVELPMGDLSRYPSDAL